MMLWYGGNSGGLLPGAWDGAEITTGELFNYYRSKSDIALATLLR
jgi:hypothetical protein